MRVIIQAVEFLRHSTASAETAKVASENAKLKVELAGLRMEVAELRADLQRAHAQVKQPPPAEKDAGLDVEELARSIMGRVCFMIDARIERITNRLLP